MESKLELCQLEKLIIIYKLKGQSSLINLFHFCSVNLCNELKRKQKYYFRTFNFSNSQIEILDSFSSSTNVNVNISFPNSNFEGNLCVMQVILTLSRPEKWILEIATYIIQKVLNFFICVEFKILCKKVKYVWSSHFPEAITTNMQLGNESFVCEYRVTCKQKISKLTLILLKLM